jgi:hypothetical protein
VAVTEERTVHEQTRARYPDDSGIVEREGVRVFYEVYGEGEPTILLLPTWSIVHSRCWKMQIPYLARHCRVLTFDARGNGRSDRPEDPDAYAEAEFAADALAVLDVTETSRAVVVGWSMGAQRALLLAASSSSAPLSRSLRRHRGPARSSRSTSDSRTTKAGRRTTATTGSSTTPTSCTSSSHRSSPSRTQRSRSRTRPAGAWRRLPRR